MAAVHRKRYECGDDKYVHPYVVCVFVTGMPQIILCPSVLCVALDESIYEGWCVLRITDGHVVSIGVTPHCNEALSYEPVPVYPYLKTRK